MRITRPSLTLEFPEGEAIHGDVQTIGPEDIVSGSVSVSIQVLNGLRPSTGTCRLTIRPGVEALEDIIAAEGNVKAVLKDWDEVVFTGYLSTGWNWGIGAYGARSLDVTIEDVGRRLLSKTFTDGGRHLFRCRASRVVDEVCLRAGVTISDSDMCPEVDVVKVVESGETCADILSDMLYELGCTYTFDNSGFLRIVAIPTDGIPSLTVDSGSLSGEVTLRKEMRRYGGSRISYTELGEANDYLVYRNTTGGDSTHPYCNMTIPAGMHFDGTEIWSDADWNGSTWREDAQIEACNASSESDLVGSGTIVSAASPSIECISTGGNVVAEVKSSGGPYISMDVHNRGAMPSTVTRLDVKADILYRKAVSVLRTGDPDDVFEESMEYVHTLDGARRHANLVDQYNRCSGSVYTFRTDADIVPCSIVRLRDDVFTGLDVNVLVTAMKDDDRSDFRTYTAVGITGFSLDDDVYSRRTSAVGGSPRKGASAYEVAIAEGFVGDIDDWLQSLKGEDGRGLTVNVTSSNGSIFRMDGVDTVLSCQVLENGRDITDSLGDERFRWIRNTGDESEDEKWNTGSKALYHKTLHVLPEDCRGRTVFACEVDLG